MPNPEFPYYDGQPVDISPAGWLVLMGSVVAAYLLLITLPLVTAELTWVPAIAFTGLPLLVLAIVTRGNHLALFGRIGLKELALAFGFGILTVVASFAVGLILLRFTTMTENASAGELAQIDAAGLALFVVRTLIQLIGEELMTILPFLAVLWLLVRRLRLPRGCGIVAGVVVSTALFAALHLPTYDWNYLQCFVGIGSARLILTASYLLTRNLWVCAGAHIVNDNTEFFLPCSSSEGTRR